MDLLIISDSLPPKHSGAGKRIFAFYKYLKANNYLTKIITYRNNALNYDSDIIQIKEINSIKKFPRIRYLLAFLRSLLSLLNLCVLKGLSLKSSQKVLWCTSVTPLTIAGSIIFKAAGFKVITQNTLLGSDDPSIFSKRWSSISIVRQLKRLQYLLSDTITCISPALYSATIEYFSNCVMIPNPVQLDKNITSNNTVTSNKQVLIVARTSLRKGFDISINTVKEVHKIDPSIKFLFVGPNDSAPAAYLQTLKDSHEINQENVRLEGYQQNTKPYYDNSSLFFLPSRREGFGTVFLEAMGAGLPVVAKKIDGITDYIFGDEYETVIDTEDPKVFAQEIIDVLDHPEKYVRLVDIGLNRVKFFEANAIYNKYIQLLTSCKT